MQSLNEFLESAQVGEFNFGSNVHGFYDVNDPDSEITMISHNVESSLINALRTFTGTMLRKKSLLIVTLCLLVSGTTTIRSTQTALTLKSQ